MDRIYLILTLCSSGLFFYYGIAGFRSEYMTSEFDRWGMASLQRLTSTLEICGALGLLVGLVVPVLGLLAASGLSVMMLMATVVRIRIGDPVPAMLPAISLAVINAFLAFGLWNTL